MKHWNLRNLLQLNMNILQMEYVDLTPSWSASNISSSFTRIYVVTAGEGWLKYGTTVLRMSPGNVYIIPAGLTFSYGCAAGFSKIFFHISIRQNKEYDIFQIFDRCLEFADPEGTELIKSNLNCDTVLKITSIKAYLYNLIYKCMKHGADVKIQEYSDYVLGAMEYIEKNLSSNLTVERIAKDLYTSPGKLRKAFRSETGTTIGKYIDDHVMFVAELEVCNSSLSIKEISDRLGFCDQFYFSRCFSQKYGISPIQYRNKQI